jgi:transposase
MTFVRKIKTKSGTYLAEVTGYRDAKGSVRQRVKYLGKDVGGKPEKRVLKSEVGIKSVKRSLDVLAVDKTAKELKLDSLSNKYVLALVYSQVLEKKSINQLEEWLRFTEIPDVLGISDTSAKQLYESLAEINEDEFSRVNSELYRQFKSLEPSDDAAVIDVTDTYFEGSALNQKRRKGKDGRVRKLLQLGLAVTFKHGFPLFYKKYHGNLSNVNIFKDMALELKSHSLNAVIVDRGMMSAENITLTKKLGAYIIAGVKKTPALVDSYLSKVTRDDLYTLSHRIVLKKTTVFAKEFAHGDGKLVVVYNPALEVVKKEHVFQRGEEVTDAYMGFSLIYHTTPYSAAEVVKQYYEKEIIERAFKQLKGVLSLRPIRVWLESHVDGHVRVCYLAYAILTWMNYKLRTLKVSAVDALDSLRFGYSVTLNSGKDEWSLHVPLKPKQKELLKALDVVYKN